MPTFAYNKRPRAAPRNKHVNLSAARRFPIVASTSKKHDLSPKTGRLCTLICCVVLGRCNSSKAPDAPTIEFTKIPPAVQGGREKVDTISGRVFGARPGQKIVIYARRGPCGCGPADKALIPIQSDSSWTTPTHLGFEYALLVERSVEHLLPWM